MKHEQVRFRRWGLFVLAAILAATAAACGEREEAVTGVEVRAAKGGTEKVGDRRATNRPRATPRSSRPIP